MAKQIISKKKAHALSTALFLVGLGIIAYFKYWWPGIMLAVGIPLALRQYLLGRIYDMTISLIVFLGVFVTVQFKITWDILLPVIFTIGGIYIFFREFFTNKKEPEEEDKSEEESKKDS
ncbi:MAG: hypothetical protein AMS24_00910 [Chlamydiae bacterium SM23_39]|nr:MAG: hypothetical protein AMS24_00910 [Chlamydiae bacterium SM23_39]